jgi:hypothetical protein
MLVAAMVSLSLAAQASEPPPPPVMLPPPKVDTPAARPRSQTPAPAPEKPAPDPHLAEVGLCYWRTLGPTGQQALERWEAKYGLENMLRFGLNGPIGECDPNVNKHFEATLWVIRGRVMREIAVAALAEKSITEAKLEKSLTESAQLRELLRKGAQTLFDTRDGSIVVTDFGFTGYKEFKDGSPEQYVNKYAAYYYIGRAIEEVQVERMGGPTAFGAAH